MSIRPLYGRELKQETYFVEGKGWRTHHVIDQNSSFEREATEDEIQAAKNQAEPAEAEPVEAEAPKKKPGRPKKAD